MEVTKDFKDKKEFDKQFDWETKEAFSSEIETRVYKL